MYKTIAFCVFCRFSKMSPESAPKMLFLCYNERTSLKRLENTEMKKCTALLLLLAMLASGLMGCSDAEGQKETAAAADNTAAETVAETEYTDVLGARDFAGADFHMAGVSTAFNTGEQTGEAINDALYTRDQLLEETYNIHIVTTPYDDDAILTDTKNLVQAGDPLYDMVVHTISNTLKTLGTGGMLYDINSLPTIDLTQKWWSTYANTNLQVGGKLLFTAGDITPTYYNIPYAIGFNMKLATDQNNDLYALVREGTWTLDKFGELCLQYTLDLNGDGKMTNADQVGYAHVRTEITSLCHYIGCGFTLNTIEDGKIVVNLAGDNSVTAIQKLSDIFGSIKDNYFTMDDPIPMFHAGQALFYGNSMTSLITRFRDMEDDFGFLPLPKWDEQQENYRTSVNTWTAGYVGVPKTIADPDRVGFMMEAMAYMSNKYVRPAAYDNMLFSKVARSEEAAEMLDIIYESVYLDANYVFNFGGSGTAVFKAIMDGKPFVSSYESVKQKIGTAIEELESNLQ